MDGSCCACRAYARGTWTYYRWVYILERERATRATIKALPATPHLPRPYGDLSPQGRRPLQNRKRYVQISYVWRITWARAYGHSRGHSCRSEALCRGYRHPSEAQA